jgi:hypothetical protein
VPESFNLALTGSRGGGKSFLVAILLLRHIIKYGENAKCWYIRQSHSGCDDFIQICRQLFGRIFGSAVRYNTNDGVWRGFPNGGHLLIDQVSSYAEYNKFQGKSATCIALDELGQYPTDELPSLLRSNLRGPLDVPTRMIYASNPCGIGHSWIYRKFVLSALPWHPYEVDGATWVTAPSLFTQNPFIDVEKYKRDLEAACAFDSELLRAFRDGAWDVVRGGAYFAHCLNEERVMFKAWELPKGVTVREYLKPAPAPSPTTNNISLMEPDLEEWHFRLGMDWGYSAPTVCYLCAVSPGAKVEGRWYPRGSVLLLDEVCTARPGQPHVGSELSVEDVAVLIRDMCARWGVRATGVCDDACGIRNDKGVSIVDTFAANKVHFQGAHKGSRIGGWTLMRELLNSASLGHVDKPGLFVSDKCRYWFETVPFLSRSMRHPEDLEGICDHGADACRYLCVMHRRNPMPQREF